MRSLFLKSMQLFQKEQPIIVHPLQQPIQPPMVPSPFTIPEILERIFSFLDEYTLRKSVMVCRLWHQMNQHLVVRELIWDTHVSVYDINKFLSKLPNSSRLMWFYDWGMPSFDSWNKLARTLREGMIVKQPASTQLGNSLRELEFRTGRTISHGLFDSFPFPPTLLSFKLVVQEGSCTFPPGHLLKTCPLLEEFHVEVVKDYLHLIGSLVPSGLEEQGRQFLPLRSLVLRNAIFAQSSLEELLLVTPRIKELRLIGLHNPPPQNGFLTNSSYSRVHLVQHIQSLPIMLSSFHFSVYHPLMNEPENDEPETDEMVRSPIPLEAGRSFFAPDLTPSMMRELDKDANFVTSLELYWRQTWSDKCISTSSSLLHRFMCSSRHLLHVRTSNVAFQFEQLDIHRLSPITNPSETVSVQTGVWACTNLRTLHLELHGHDQFQLIHDVNSRIVFGYISTVCPRLQDLQLVLPKVCLTRKMYEFKKLSARLMGGFALLSRLKYLERLWIEFSELDPLQAHVNWMVPSGRTAKFKARRQKLTSSWNSTIRKEKLKLKDPAETTRLSLMDKDVLHWSELEPMAKRALWRLGLLMEVKTVLEQIDTPDWECWPLLHKMSLNGGFEQHPQACVRNLSQWGDNVYRSRLFLQLDRRRCLLSSLDRLKKLKVIYGDEETRGVDCQEYELNWISPSGHRNKDRMRRAETMANWTLQLEAEDTLERRFPYLSKSTTAIGNDPVDRLRNLGLLSEVKAVDEMDGSDQPCLS
ncbi:MAG: hypothetical protein J3R72DRAFT_525527 [Linnemannia gamsii]|nr:MAG: hypothetical protein J3R72DRAFT_525527 [Linnemannia gamsii]